MYKIYRFQCDTCQHEFKDMVDGEDGLPDECPNCDITEGFTKLVSSPMQMKIVAPTVKPCHYSRAGRWHLGPGRKAEKAGRQISMYGTDKSLKRKNTNASAAGGASTSGNKKSGKA